MSGLGPQPHCACPRDDARACLRVRSNRDLAGLMFADEPSPYGADDDEECECGCHGLGVEDDEGQP